MDYRFGLRVELEILLGLLTVDVDGFLNHIATAQTLGFLLGQTEDGVALQFKLRLDRISDKGRLAVLTLDHLEFEW